MSRRARAVAFAVAALACAGLAATAVSGYRAETEAGYGPLRAVVATRAGLPAGRAIRPRAVKQALELRRVPERFVAADALEAPEEALGRVPRTPIPPGSYLLASQLAEPRDRGRRSALQPGAGRAPVEIAVGGAGALAAPAGRRSVRVDVVVTSEPGPGRGPGRTRVAVENVRLLELRPAAAEDDVGPGPGSGAVWIATLALTRPEALRLIQAESFARQVRLIGR